MMQLRKGILSLLLSSTCLSYCAAGRGSVRGLVSFGNLFPHRATHIDTLKAECTQVGQSEGLVPQRTKPLWQNLSAVKNANTVTGDALLELARSYEIFYCTDEMDKGLNGYYSHGNTGAVILSSSPRTPEQLTLTQMHETVHVAQDLNSDAIPRPDWRLEDFQARELAAEAAATTGALLFAAEARAQGEPRFWSADLAFENRRTLEKITNVFAKARLDGASPSEAAKKAGEAGFTEQFNRQQWLDTYNRDILAHFVKNIMNDKLRPPAETPVFGTVEAQRAGKISQHFNFTARVRLPGYAARFGSNPHMKDAFDVAEYHRYARTLGENHPRTRKLHAHLVAKGNRHIGFSLNQLAAILNVEPRK